MSELLESTPDDCEALAFGMSTLIEATPSEIGEARLPDGHGADGAAFEELRANLKPKLVRMQAAFAMALPQCSGRLATELARASRGGDGQPR
ncbi:MAG TPA: hypothetical protein VFZ61_20740 [Polyangiales bacterium]